jgi:hypothetical protein
MTKKVPQCIKTAKTSNANSSDYHNPHTVEDVSAQNVETIMRLEDAAKTNRDLTDRMSDLIAKFAAVLPSCGYIWMGANQRFAEFPAF